MSDTVDLRSKLIGCGLDVNLEGDRLWLRDDVSCPPDEEPHDAVWDRYCFIQELLEGFGVKIADVYLEHDCISGAIVPIENEVSGTGAHTITIAGS